MRKLVLIIALCCSSRVVVAQERRIGEIGFFGQKGFDTNAILHALPFGEGSVVSMAEADREPWKETVRGAVKRIIGQEPTDVARLCCDAAGNLLVYIGLPGSSSRTIQYNPSPRGNDRLPQDFVSLNDEIDDLMFKALIEGRAGAGEDHSSGYALAKGDPLLRSKQLQLRQHALSNETELFAVAKSSSDPKHRAIAAYALGYTRQSKRQVAALVEASFDPDGEVRNSAVRALAVLLSAKPEVGREIPARRYIDLLYSGTWTARNKGLAVVDTSAKRAIQNFLLCSALKRQSP
jgi:hypothetical protein